MFDIVTFGHPSLKMKSQDVENFEPFGVGYVEIHDEVKVETRLTTADKDLLKIGMEMELKFIPAYTDDDGNEVITFAFAPVER